MRKPSPERVTEKQMIKIRGPWDGKKKTLLSLPSNAQLVKGGQDDYLFSMKAQNRYFFQMHMYSKQILFGGWNLSCAPGDKKAQNGSSVTCCITLHAVIATECHKKQRGHASYWNSEYMFEHVLDRAIIRCWCNEHSAGGVGEDVDVLLSVLLLCVQS